jgi:hypothetical protein
MAHGDALREAPPPLVASCLFRLLAFGPRMLWMHRWATRLRFPARPACRGSAHPGAALTSAPIRAAIAGWRRSLSRQRLRLGPMLPTGMPSRALISA